MNSTIQTDKAVALLQDLQLLVADIQPLLSSDKVADIQPAAAVRHKRLAIGELLADLTNPGTIVQAYRDDAIDGIVGVTGMMIKQDDWTNQDLQKALVGMELACGRVRSYLQLLAFGKEAPCAIG